MSLFASSSSATAGVDLKAFIIPKNSKDQSQNAPEPPKIKTRRTKAEAIAASKEELKRTIFIGNLPLECAIEVKAQEKVKKYLKGKVGDVESIRFRRLLTFKDDKVMSRPDMLLLKKSRKLREKALETQKGSSNAYVVFVKEESVGKALELNATLYHERHLRVDRADVPSVPSHKKCIFVGNLALDAEDEDVWQAFETLPQFKVTQVRIIRDKETNRGKGFAYVAFSDRAMVRLALDSFSESDPLKIKNRAVRISKCVQPGGKKSASSTTAKKAPFPSFRGGMKNKK